MFQLYLVSWDANSTFNWKREVGNCREILGLDYIDDIVRQQASNDSIGCQNIFLQMLTNRIVKFRTR